MEWNEFVQRLARELTHLPDSAFLVVQMPGGFPYVQAMRNSDGLSAEVVSNEFLPLPMRLGPEQEERLTEIGWHPPGQDGHLNWWQQVRLPAEFDDFTPDEAIAVGRLAGAMATALNEVFRVRTPFDLEYHANQNGPDNGPIELPYFGLRPAETGYASRTGRMPGTDSPVAGPPGPAPSVAASSGVVPPVPTPAAAGPADAGFAGPGPALPSRSPAAASPAAASPPAASLGAFPAEAASVATASVPAPGAPLPPSAPPRPARPRPLAPQPAPEPAVAPAPEPAHEPAAAARATAPPEAELESLLAGAREKGDQRSYFQLLLLADLVMPSTGDPTAERFATANFDDGTYVLAFTSRGAMEQSLRGQAGFHRRTTFAELARNWPKPEWRLAVNAGLPTAAYIDSDTINRLAEEERAAGDPPPATAAPARPAATATAAPRQEPVPEPEPGPQDAPAPRKTGPTIMQKVVPHQHVSHYLENAYDQVAGYVHRIQDVGRLETPEQLVRGLGLTYEGSPFSDQDEEVHVIRWPVVKGSLYRAPYGGQDEAAMRRVPDGWVIEKPPFLGTGYAPGDSEAIAEFKIDSQRLPHGAEMYRIGRSGPPAFVAYFDTDHRRWIKVQG
ncbi:TY-Chap domain-containing protein [Actinomadura scrupuli]|uniref:TY-Chap domain-containing protein n=1 Tax=Actinomadura scrupuli TaxID=559629 RepID=UPI003D97291D